MGENRVYKVSEQTMADLNEAYDALFRSEDINRRFREAGEPRPEAEAKQREARERLERFAKSFEVPLE